MRFLALALCAGAALAGIHAGLAGSPPAIDGIPTTTPPLVGARDDAGYRRLVPEGVFTADELARLVFYDERTAPQVYQDDGRLRRVGVAASPNAEFPWKTGGMDDSPNGHSFKALLLPPGQAIAGQAVILSGDARPTLVGTYPPGSRVAEFLMVDSGHNPKGWAGWHTFEVRLLEKQDGDTWKPRWFRAVKDAAHLQNLVRGTSYADHLRTHYAAGWSVKELFDNRPRPAFYGRAIHDDLPAMPAALFARVHGGTFSEVTDRPWAESSRGNKAFAGSGGPFPREYRGNYFTSSHCLACHKTVLAHARDFDPGRAWSGRVRGTDGIFSLPLVEGEDGAAPRWSKRLIEAGLLRVESARLPR